MPIVLSDKALPGWVSFSRERVASMGLCLLTRDTLARAGHGQPNACAASRQTLKSCPSVRPLLWQYNNTTMQQCNIHVYPRATGFISRIMQCILLNYSQAQAKPQIRRGIIRMISERLSSCELTSQPALAPPPTPPPPSLALGLQVQVTTDRR